MSRSARTKKKVDYTKFGDDDDFDDDFADLTPPPAKKQKTSSSKDLQKKVTANQEKKKAKRVPLDEKIYDRDLQAALELSIIESQSSNCDNDDEDFKPKNNKKTCATKTEKNDKTQVKSQSIVETTKNEVLCTAEVNEEKLITSGEIDVSDKYIEDKMIENKPQNCDVLQEIKRNIEAEDSDGIVVLDDDEELSKRSRRKSMTKAKVIDSDEDDSEFALDDEDDEEDSSDDNYEEENDSDFDCGGKSKKQNSKRKSSTPKSKTKSNAITNAAQSKPQNAPKAKSVKNTGLPKGTQKSPAVTARPVLKSPASRPALASPVVRNVPKWNPPGAAGIVKSPLGGVTIKSPSSGMRIGLSRNQRVKSLHPGLGLKAT